MSRGKSRQAGLPGLPGSAVLGDGEGHRPTLPPLRPGQTICDLHGGKDPRKQRAADRRASVAQLMQHEDPDAPRPLGEVMLDAVHNADVLMRSLRDVRLRVARDEPVSGEDVDRLVRMSQVAHASWPRRRFARASRSPWCGRPRSRPS